jgi:signal-transduction protein with cAMP-binding, CBS, and nucleotidyltransferase domain
VSFPTRLISSPSGYSSGVKRWRPLAAEARRVHLSDPARLVMTDFTREPPATVTEDRTIDDALVDMVVAGVHALLVVRGDVVRGLITSYDIQGDRPLILLRSSSYRPVDQIEVRQIMTRWDLVAKLDWSSVNAAPVFDLARAFRRTGASHVVIVENVEHKGAFVRALISRRRLIRQLGLDE